MQLEVILQYFAKIGPGHIQAAQQALKISNRANRQATTKTTTTTTMTSTTMTTTTTMMTTTTMTAMTTMTMTKKYIKNKGYNGGGRKF